MFTALKPDGKVIFNQCEISENRIVYHLTAQTCAAAGSMPCQIRLYGYDDELLLSPRFSIEVLPSVYSDGDVIESSEEFTALTALVTDAGELIDSLRQSLTDGDFIPQISVGSVETLPAGSFARVEITGAKESPVLNFAIPQGEVGTNEELIPDTEFSLSSTRPVQNKLITAALAEKADKAETELSIGKMVEKEVFSETLSNFVELEEFGNKLAQKVDKAEGKGLSSNDYTTAEKQKLAGIAANANNYTLPDGGVSTAKIANYAVSTAKIANNAVSKSLTVSLAAANWSGNKQTVTATGVTASNTVIVTPAPASLLAYAEAQVRCTAQAANSLTFQCEEVPETALTVNVTCINK
ncbi:MAG: hypothetical protein IJ364_09085 [Oscillospiraceae bacterium]|nr:hypothetical protein [Oscillospiraceae bacterium]